MDQSISMNKISTPLYLCFSDFEFKIRLGFCVQKQEFLYLNSQPTDSQSGVLTTTAQSQL